MRIGNLQGLEDRRHAAILAPFAMQRIEGDVGSEIGKNARDVALHIDGRDLETGIAQGLAHRPRRLLRLTSRSADQPPISTATCVSCGIRCVMALLRPPLGNPMRLISHSSSTPDVLAHARADCLAEFLDLRRSRVAFIDEEIAMELGHLRRADGKAAQAPPHRSTARISWPGRVLEGRAAGAALDRLGRLRGSG